MPTYEYECNSCGHNFEAFQSMSDAPFSDCPQCGKGIRRLINGGSGVIFKGSGFYVNDKNKDSKKHSPTEKSTGNTGESSGSTCATCPASAASGCPASEKAAG